MSVVSVRWVWLIGAVLTASCAARDAATLATITSDHVNWLNTELTEYVKAANDTRKQDAARIASARSRWEQDAADNQQVFTQWQIDNATGSLRALDALQKQSAIDLANADSYLKRQNDDQEQLQAAYGQVTYDSARLKDVIAELQKLAKRSESGVQLQLSAAFASAVVNDARKQIDSAKLKPAGGGSQ